MRAQATGTVLYAIAGIAVVAAAIFAKAVQGTIAEQAAEIVLIRALVTREVFTGFVLKIAVGHIRHFLSD